MKVKALYFTFFILCALGLNANIGQPGIWNVGGGISLLIPNDSLASQYIKMDSERVDLFVYTGFGIVNGRYTLTNTSDVNISFTMGYPMNALWRGEGDNSPFGYNFHIDSLASFEVTIDGAPEALLPMISDYSNDTLLNEKWILWEIQFAPGQTLEINVTYISPTSEAKVTNLNGERKAHGLMYIFESVAVWIDRIDKAELFVHFMDGLTTEDVIGIRPCELMRYLKTEDMLYFNKSNWKPEAGENFYLLYQSRKNKYYSFPEGIQDKDQLYTHIQKKSKKIFQIEEHLDFVCSDILDVDTKQGYINLVLYILGGALMLFILLIYIILKLVKQ